MSLTTTLALLLLPALAQDPCVGPPATLGPTQPGGFRFGAELGLSGDLLAVADWWDGEVTVFRRGVGGWTFEQLLTPSNHQSNFGSSLATDGQTIAVGASAVNDGRVFLFERVAGAWVETTVLAPATGGLESFGAALAIDADRLAVAAPNAGGVYVYLRTGGSWGLEDFVAAHNPAGAGGDVALSGDTLVVGNEVGFPFAGEVEVLRRSGSSWLPEGSLSSGSGFFDGFGANLALDGDTVLAGSAEGVHVFERAGSSWASTDLIEVPDGVEFFGGAVALAGDVALVGNWHEQLGGLDVGTVRPFERTPGGWVPRGVWYGDTVVGGSVGWSVAMDQGTYAAGAPSIDSEESSVWVWEDVPEPTTYCTAGVTALGCQGALSSTGKASASEAASFWVTLSGLEGQVPGLLFFGTSGRQANPWGNGSSFQCVSPPLRRTPVGVSTGAAGSCTGALTLDFGAWMQTHPSQAPAAGATVDLQGWFRDPASTSNQTTSLSDALEFVVAL